MTTMPLADGAELFYTDQGQGEAVVLLNGMTQTTLNWQSQASRLRKHRRVISYDARGQGQTALGTEAPTLPQHADDLVALLDHLGVARADLIGFSHGARVALQVAERHGDRLERLVICSATAQPTALARTIIRGWREVLDRGGLEAMAWAALPAILGEDFLASSEAIVDKVIAASVQRNTEEGISALLGQMIAYPDLSELARSVRAPCLVIMGEHDLLVDEAGARAMADLTGGRLAVVAGCGHTVPIEAPAAFRAEVYPFLGLDLSGA